MAQNRFDPAEINRHRSHNGEFFLLKSRTTLFDHSFAILDKIFGKDALHVKILLVTNIVWNHLGLLKIIELLLTLGQVRLSEVYFSHTGKRLG